MATLWSLPSSNFPMTLRPSTNRSTTVIHRWAPQPTLNYNYNYNYNFHSNPPKTLLSSSSHIIDTVTSTIDIDPLDTVVSDSLQPKKVLIPIGLGTEEMEAVIMVNVLRQAGADVVLASVEPELEVKLSGGTILVADTSISECSDQIFDLVALPGGMPGSVRLRDCKTLEAITKKQAEEKRLYGAICAAPAVTLLPWGLLKRKKVLIPIANGSEDIEVVTVVDILRRAKLDVTVASVEKTLSVVGSQGIKIVADQSLKNAAESIFDLIILPVSYKHNFMNKLHGCGKFILRF
ncbi:hypothetical protein M8C21_014271 [Ambrosia artemisiifolia]|uniref:DJ-1/PfpI domain-containing protein n=1 Tax=Ambrosia artemisiifolia TaxID=4212 RepID=A0AAD5CW75_AMBAR|nr:hypothetical protein M8C21_014271 [Ambrosia artemisiifolia]